MEVHYESRVVEFAKIADVNNILSTNPDAEFGTSDDSRYPNSYYKVLAIFQGAPLHLDIPSWMDLALAGIPESIAARAIEHCNVKAWIIPLGEPFIQPNWLSRQPLFSDEFRAEFRSHYSLTQEDEFYQVWTCK